MLTLVVLIVFLVAINAFFVSAEFATVSAKKSSIQQSAAEGNKFAAGLLPILEDGKLLDRYVATCQIGITFSSIVLGAFGQAALAKQLTPWIQSWSSLSNESAFAATALGLLIGLTIFQMIFGELIPKSISLQYPARVALLTYVPMRWSMTFFSWFITLLNGSGVMVLKLFGIRESSLRHIHSPEELEFLIAESRDGGALEDDEHRRLKQALSLSSRQADEIMVPRTRVVAIDLNSPLDEVTEIVMTSPYTRFPVYLGSKENIIGMLHTKDFAARYILDVNMPPLKEMLRPLPSIPSTVTADKVLSLLKKRKAHQAIIIDEHGGLDGILTLEDILSEMMGPIGDEFKRPGTVVEPLADGRTRLSGEMRLDEAERWIGILWEGDCHTISGRVIEELGHIPRPGAQVEIDGVEVEVERVVHNAIVTILARPRAQTKSNEISE